MPLLAVCRGMQLLNVAFGGDLHVDIPTAFPDAILHRSPVSGDAGRGHAGRGDSGCGGGAPGDGVSGDGGPGDGGRFAALPHLVTLDPGSQLATVMGAARFEAPSWHHQAVDELGDGLVAVGHAPDGIIEAIEMPEHPFMLGVQWHPEMAPETQREQHRLFAALIRATRGE
jgi:putative glutamine amidotransferase